MSVLLFTSILWLISSLPSALAEFHNVSFSVFFPSPCPLQKWDSYLNLGLNFLICRSRLSFFDVFLQHSSL